MEDGNNTPEESDDGECARLIGDLPWVLSRKCRNNGEKQRELQQKQA